MRCTVSGHNLRILSKSVRCLSKYTDRVKILVRDSFIVFQAKNDSSTAFCEITFGKNFFALFDFNEDFFGEVDVKSIKFVFRVINLDRIVETCKIVMDYSFDKILFEMKCKERISREFSIPYTESEPIKCRRLSERIAQPSLRADARLFADIFKHVPHSIEAITIWQKADILLFKTYNNNEDDQDMELLTTSFSWPPNEFRHYNHVEDLSVTFDIRDVKAFLDFAVHRNQMVNAYLLSGNRPMEFFFRNPDDYEARITMATYSFDDIPSPVPPHYKSPRQKNNQSTSAVNSQDSSLASIEFLNSTIDDTSPDEQIRNEMERDLHQETSIIEDDNEQNIESSSFHNEPMITSDKTPNNDQQQSQIDENSNVSETPLRQRNENSQSSNMVSNVSETPLRQTNGNSQSSNMVSNVSETPPRQTNGNSQSSNMGRQCNNSSQAFSVSDDNSDEGREFNEDISNIIEVLDNLPNFDLPTNDLQTCNYATTDFQEEHQRFFWGLNTETRQKQNKIDLVDLSFEEEEFEDEEE